MMDRFKFRVWCCNNNEWEKDEILISNHGVFKIYRNGICLGTMIDRPRFHVLEQCTGLKDKNGNLIYEGDIVSTTLSDGSKFKHIIRWYDGKFIADYGWYYHKEFEDYCSISQEWISKKEIIGNIHENGDLLK